ncbi:MAG: quinone-dependent dihydroorotate dehydrogenase [Gammaproteobacteria bacterium]|nr:quinone-dependent dihydroorotate dehydrogenase [Gammaproteobacteria bacterium]
MAYSFFRSLLFRLDAETSHHLALLGMKWLHRLGLLSRIFPKPAPKVTQLLGMQLENPVGLAAGLDKNGDYIDALGALGFGFIEIGTVTPRPQPGNPRPRLFRLPQAEAIINRMGFNNKGVDHLINQVKKRRYKGILGINIGKNFDTPIENAVDDYLLCLQKVYPYADYVTINISSPNTENLRQLQQQDELRDLLTAIKAEQKLLHQRYHRYIPVLVKIAPDLSEQDVTNIAEIINELGIDGVIATNTTISREQVQGLAHAQEHGGLSGKPVKYNSDKVLSMLATQLAKEIPIIGVGGISSAQDVRDKFSKGAQAVQIYSGFIYRGPELIHEAVDACSR